MTMREFFTKLNELALYTSRVANIDKRKMKIFINGLRLDITKDVLTKDNHSRSYTKVLARV